ncbi:MAG: acetylornithine transaminase [Pseudomonadota bacterium]
MNADNFNALMPITARPPAAMVKGRGSYLWDERGARYLDFIQGWAVNALGHCPDVIVNALTHQAKALITPSPALHNGPQWALAERLVELSGLHQVHFANSGAEANEAAVKLARKWAQHHRAGADHIITTEHSFHGRTLAMMAASGKPGWGSLFPPTVPGFRHVPFGDVAAMRDAITERTMALMVEPVQGEAGVIVPPSNYLRDLRRLADEYGLLLIFDEIQTGVGRLGTFFAFETDAIRPDIVTLGKGLGGGVPISAMIAAKPACCFEYGDQGGTYNGNPLMTAVALAVVEQVANPHFLANVRTNGARLRAGLGELAKQWPIRCIRGVGLLTAIELSDGNAVAVADAAFNEGLLINAPRPTSIRLMPALNVSGDEIDRACTLLDRAFAKLGR